MCSFEEAAISQKIIAWDFDGVLNRNIVDGQFVWKRTFDEDIGASVEDFSQYIFRSGRFGDVLVGKRDIRDLVADWLEHAPCNDTPDEILEYWFSKDALPDPKSLKLLSQARKAGFKNVLATNNERRRLSFIRNEMGFGNLLDDFFAAGPMGYKKPDTAFFKMIGQALDAPAKDFLLIDDKLENVDAAQSIGWHAFFFQDGDHIGLAAAIEQFRVEAK